MFPDSINLTTITLTLFVVCAGFVLLRGVLRILLGCVVLGSSAWVGFRLWQLAPAYVTACFGNSMQWLAVAIPVVAFVFTFYIGRLVVRLLASPFQKSSEPRPPLTFTRLLGAAVFTLIPTCLIGTIAAILIYHVGAVAEIKHTTGQAPTSAVVELCQRLKTSIETSIPSAWLKLLDPLADPARLTLAKIITQQSLPQRQPVIDPQTGQPVPRAIIVNDPELQNLARDGKFATLLRSPLLTKALNDPKVQAFLTKLDL